MNFTSRSLVRGRSYSKPDASSIKIPQNESSARRQGPSITNLIVYNSPIIDSKRIDGFSGDPFA
jgi:hypothetical protein